MEALSLLEALVRVPSLSRSEGPAADIVENVFRAQPSLQVGRVGDNVWAAIGQGDDVLLLNSHLDVVPPSAEHPYPPFEPTRVDGRMYGRGTSDAKASGAAMVSALLRLASAGYAPPAGGRVVVALTACEETGGADNGMELLRSHLFGNELPDVSAALVGEPTDLRPCLAQKGLLILECVARGRTAHAGRPHLGDNAITRAAEDALRLQGLLFEREDALLGAPTATVTTIRGGTARNVVPDECTFTVDVRSTPAYTHAELTASIAAHLSSEVRVSSDRLVPCSTPPTARIARATVDALRSAGSDAEPFGSPTASDWVFLADVPTVKIGPGRSELSHGPDEHVEVEEVGRAVDLYADIIRRYFAS